nr:MAG TPA: Tetracyclin repressor-like, C-terminal domain [Caudoviricetes sp.]
MQVFFYIVGIWDLTNKTKAARRLLENTRKGGLS